MGGKDTKGKGQSTESKRKVEHIDQWKRQEIVKEYKEIIDQSYIGKDKSDETLCGKITSGRRKSDHGCARWWSKQI